MIALAIGCVYFWWANSRDDELFDQWEVASKEHYEKMKSYSGAVSANAEINEPLVIWFSGEGANCIHWERRGKRPPLVIAVRPSFKAPVKFQSIVLVHGSIAESRSYAMTRTTRGPLGSETKYPPTTETVTTWKLEVSVFNGDVTERRASATFNPPKLPSSHTGYPRQCPDESEIWRWISTLSTAGGQRN